jgi:hypothetical protein
MSADPEDRLVARTFLAFLVCLGCGCAYLKPCDPPCHWVAFNEATLHGICSRCVDKPIEELLLGLAIQ